MHCSRSFPIRRLPQRRIGSPDFQERSEAPRAVEVHAQQFAIKHFAGPVVYTASGMMEKNVDAPPQEAVDLVTTSSVELVRLRLAFPPEDLFTILLQLLCTQYTIGVGFFTLTTLQLPVVCELS